MILMKQLEAKKRCDEREKKREEMKNKVDRERERRMEQKRCLLVIVFIMAIWVVEFSNIGYKIRKVIA